MSLITKNDITVPVTVQTRTALPPAQAFQPAIDLSLVFKGWGPVTGFTNIVLRRLIYGVRGEWTFTPDGSGSVIRWTYEFKPVRRRYWIVRHVLAPLWRNYMQAGVEASAYVAEKS